MKYYKSYLDRQEISPAVHEKLLELERPRRRPAPWLKYVALAACAVIAVGVGAWRLAPGAPAGNPHSAAQFVPEDQPQLEEKDTAENPQGGVKDELAQGIMIPYIEYGPSAEESRAPSKVSADYAAPEGSTSRELTREDVVALAGGEEVLDAELGWDGFAFSGSVIFDGEGKVWQICLAGKRDDFFFELELAPDALPLTCVMTEPHAVTEVWGVEITARRAGIHGEGSDREVWMPESREVEFIANGVGCRFTLYGLEGQGAAVEEMVARFVRQSVLEGLCLQNVL